MIIIVDKFTKPHPCIVFTLVCNKLGLQKSTETRHKKKKNVKNVGMACQKVCKQGRDDIIVKVNLQSPIPTSFYIAVLSKLKTTLTMVPSM